MIKNLRHSKIRNSVNQITFSVTVMIISHAQITMVKASTCPKNVPILSQTSFILINPFETCEISDANMATIAMMNWTERHQTGPMVLRIFGITVWIPIIEFLFA